jgi:hypothetical protein
MLISHLYKLKTNHKGIIKSKDEHVSGTKHHVMKVDWGCGGRTSYISYAGIRRK